MCVNEGVKIELKKKGEEGDEKGGRVVGRVESSLTKVFRYWN